MRAHIPRRPPGLLRKVSSFIIQTRDSRRTGQGAGGPRWTVHVNQKRWSGPGDGRVTEISTSHSWKRRSRPFKVRRSGAAVARPVRTSPPRGSSPPITRRFSSSFASIVLSSLPPRPTQPRHFLPVGIPQLGLASKLSAARVRPRARACARGGSKLLKPHNPLNTLPIPLNGLM